jgi:peptidoglycan/xylan/chitin deacetylase (PgdA/CDA1 family)
LLLASIAGAAEPRRVAITVDDLPWVEFGMMDETTAVARQQRLVGALAGTHAIGFVNEDKLYRDGALVPSRRAMLAGWLDAGLDLGNHTFGHVGMHATKIADYEAAIARGDDLTGELLAAHGRKPRWFRHPYLQAGRVDADRDRLDRFLAGHGYRVAPVTIDNGEWIFARAYVLLKTDVGRAGMRERYIDYIDAKFAYYEDQSRRLFGREIPQVLLLHANSLNAAALPALLARIRRRGYAFENLDDVMADPAYAHADGYRGGAGISWMHRWAMAEDKPREFYQGEPTVPPDVLALAGVEGE